MPRSALTLVYRLTLLGATLALAACASGPKIYTNTDSSADFSRYQTYGFFEELATDKADYESTESRLLKAAVAREMSLRNLTFSDQPDLTVNFFINTEEKIRSRSSPTTGAYYGYRGSRYGAWGSYGTETRIDQYTEGTLHIDIVDSATEKLVWDGAIVGKVTEEVRQNLEPVINEAVVAIFEKFPVPAKTAAAGTAE